MNRQIQIVDWATDCLVSLGYTIKQKPECILSTPWSSVYRISTSIGDIYLKQTPPALFLASEPTIIKYLSEQFHASVPDVIAIYDDQHCFLMKDAGEPLRKTLKNKFQIELLCRAIKEYASIQRSTERHFEAFLGMGVPDWRLDKLPRLYDQMIRKTDFLKAEGLTEDELHLLRSLSPQFSTQCELLSRHAIPETLGYHDFHDNNVLIDANTHKMTFVDWGETAIIHPFFSLLTCLEQAATHHGIEVGNQWYQQLQEACLENWSELSDNKHLADAFKLAGKLAPFFGALACYQFMMSVDLQSYKTYYLNRPSKIAHYFRVLIQNFSDNDCRRDRDA